MDLYELDSAITEGEIAYAATADWEEARALREALYILQIVKAMMEDDVQSLPEVDKDTGNYYI